MPKRRSPGEGSVYQRKSDSLWACSLSWLDANGHRRRKTLYAKTRRAVLEKLREAQRNPPSTQPPDPPSMTYGEYLHNWLENTVRQGVRVTTFVNHEALTRNHIIPVLGHVPLRDLTPDHIEALRAQKLREGLASTTVKVIHNLLVGSLEVAYRRGHTARNVAKLAGPLRARRRDIHPFNQEQARRFLEVARGTRLAGLYTVALTLGLRRGELLGLLWQDVDLERGTLRVEGSLQNVGGVLMRLEPKSEKSRRAIRLPSVVLDALHTHRAAQAFERKVAGPKWRGTGDNDSSTDYVFCTHLGSPIFPSTLTWQFRALLKKHGFAHIRLHDLRHTCATLSIQAGIPIHLVSRMLGHANISTTLQLYSHILESAEMEAVTRIDELYRGI